jgi:hypothetical protein
MVIGSIVLPVVQSCYIRVSLAYAIAKKADKTDAKRILTEAIATDTRFLAAQSVMDYSLLLGIDKSTKELVVGIVDSIGSYDLWKTIESKGKLLTRGGEVTVVGLSPKSLKTG